MTTLEIVKAWKDEDYRESLTDQERAQLPEHPSGRIEFQAAELADEKSFEGFKSKQCFTHHTCTCGHGCS